MFTISAGSGVGVREAGWTEALMSEEPVKSEVDIT